MAIRQARIAQSTKSWRYTPVKDQFDVLRKKLVEVSDALCRDTRTLNSSLQKAATPIINELQVKYNAYDKSGSDGNLKVIFNAKPSRNRRGVIIIGPDRSKSKGWQLLHLIEYGSVGRYMKRGLRDGNITQKMQVYKLPNAPAKFKPYKGKYTGVMPAKRYMLTTMMQNESKVLDIMTQEIKKVSDKKLKQMGW